MELPITIRGRIIDHQELECIKQAICQGWARGRTWISQELCRQWDWRQGNGQLKDQVCRILLNELSRRGLVELPARKRAAQVAQRYYLAPSIPPSYAQEPLEGKLKDFPAVTLRMVRRTSEEALWNYLVHRYHYKGFRILVGSHLKYIALFNDTPVACLAWGSSVFRIGDRDRFLNWSAQERTGNIRFIANNTRFLILPWVRVKNLASHLLALSARVVSRDWQNFYGHPIYLLETFVETARFQGICYRAANWIRVGSTKGHAKRNGQFYYHGNPKDIYVYPLINEYRSRLAAGGESC